MATTKGGRVFDTDRRIRLGIWGLGRGLSFYQSCRALNMDVVAGCDYNAHMRERFLSMNPNALATADADEFLSADFDAVLLATFCPDHAADAIACLRAGKHVLSEVTAFHTLAEGVRLVEAVEASGLVYNLAENCPWSQANMWLARKWREGLFGELMYGEYEYVHEIRRLCYTYTDREPIQPGNSVHFWRSWLSFHYYNTHSLGPIMHITGTRPTRVVALPSTPHLPGYPVSHLSMANAAPSLINMSNGAVVRNLMGAMTNDTHQQRLWGTKGSAEFIDGKLRVRLGGSGLSPKHEIMPRWEALGDLASGTGHGGADFWVLYYFARQILEGTPAPFDVYVAADCTVPGIQAVRSACHNGQPYEVPDLRDPAQREAYRDDDFAQPRYDTRNGLFPAGSDENITRKFTRTMRDLIDATLAYRAWVEWSKVQEDMQAPHAPLQQADALLEALPLLQGVIPVAHEIMAHAPHSDGARVLGEMLAEVDAARILKPDFRAEVEAERAALARRAEEIITSREAETR